MCVGTPGKLDTALVGEKCGQSLRGIGVQIPVGPSIQTPGGPNLGSVSRETPGASLLCRACGAGRPGNRITEAGLVAPH